MGEIKNFPYDSSAQSAPQKNAFVQQAEKEANLIRTGNQALAYKELDDKFITDFVQSAGVKQVVDPQMAINSFKELLDIDPVRATLNAVYLRIITRDVKDLEGKRLGVHIGAGLRKLPMIRFYTLAIFYPQLFEVVKWYIPIVGRWKDFIDLLMFDLLYNDNDWDKRKLNWDSIFEVISFGLNTGFVDLIKKYLPQIRANSKIATNRQAARNAVAKWLAYKLFPDAKDKYVQYRRFKSSGKAHQWQQLISRRQFDQIDFDTIPTRALLHFVMSGMANRYVRDRFLQWLEKTRKIEFKGFPYEILNSVNVSKATDDYVIRTIINKSFEGLISNIVQKQSDILTVVDISGSMSFGTIDGRVSAIDVARSLAVLFSYSLQSSFKNMVWMFSDEAQVVVFNDEDDPVTRFNKIDGSWGSTNPMKVFYKFVEFRNKGVPESDFPKTILMISDGEFNYYLGEDGEVMFKDKVISVLKDGGFSDDFISQLKIILWDIRNDYYEQGRKTVFHTDSVEDDMIIYISGFDGSIINFLLGIEGKMKEAKTTKEIYENAMNQPLLKELAEKLSQALKQA